MGKWQIATCEECGEDVPYLPDWDEPRFCKACRFYEADCAICGQAMRIGRDWEHPPKVHKECRERAQAEREERNSKWYDAHCKECGTLMRLCREWDKQPEYCNECAWHEIDCGICGRPMRVHRARAKPPWAHPECRKRFGARDVDCATCGGTFRLSTRLQVNCHRHGYELPTRCRQCKHDALLVRAAIGALRDELGVPLEAEIERRGILFTEAVAIERERRTGKVVAEVRMDEQGVIFTERVAIVRCAETNKIVSSTREGARSFISGQRSADTYRGTSTKRTHVSTNERQGIILPTTVTQTTRVDDPKAKPATTTRRVGFLDRLLGRFRMGSD